MTRNILITGGAGFIGSHLVNYFVDKYLDDNIIVLDSLTYAADLRNITTKNAFEFKVGDIRDEYVIDKLFNDHNINLVIHLAAESHVDNSINSPNIFVETNVMGTINLLNVARKYWEPKNYENCLFYHVSTDEVYGSLSASDASSKENDPYIPRSPYSASKASSDHFVRAYNETYGLPTIISNCSNNYGPHQHSEKFIPTILKSLHNKTNIPIYGEGLNIRDWLYVEDHVKAIDCIINNGVIGETYNIGGDNELTNIELVNQICIIYYTYLNNGKVPDVVDIPIEYVTDRKGHDFRYSINCDKLKSLGWKQETDFSEGITETIKYYKNKFNQ